MPSPFHFTTWLLKTGIAVGFDSTLASVLGRAGVRRSRPELPDRPGPLRTCRRRRRRAAVCRCVRVPGKVRSAARQRTPGGAERAIRSVSRVRSMSTSRQRWPGRPLNRGLLRHARQHCGTAGWQTPFPRGSSKSSTPGRERSVSTLAEVLSSRVEHFAFESTYHRRGTRRPREGTEDHEVIEGKVPIARTSTSREFFKILFVSLRRLRIFMFPVVNEHRRCVSAALS